MQLWRLIPYGEYTGAANMAIDEFLLENLISGSGSSTLRLYGFAPPTVSIGLNQKLDPETIQRICNAGLHVVRRPTGGRAVLHLDDLTYSFIAEDESRGGIFKTSVTAAYKQICNGLIKSLESIGVETEVGESQSAYRHLADCFHATTAADLHYRGKKIAGSAQLRRKGVVLQHGSIPLKQSQKAMKDLLEGVKSESSSEGASRHVNLFEVTAERSYSELDGAFKWGFEDAFGVSFEVVPLSTRELAEAEAHASRFTLSPPLAHPLEGNTH